MPAEAATLSKRLAALSPQQRALLTRRLLQDASPDAISPNDKIPSHSRDNRREFPLSAAQERMWFNHQWSPDQPLYNETFALKLEGRVRAEILAQSFDLVMARHEIFSTTFHSAEGRLLQRVAACSLPRLDIRDLRDLAAGRRVAKYQAEAQVLVREPFQLDKGPLFRAALWRLDEDQYRLLFTMHHIIFDGWSGGIFFRELFGAYAALLEGREPKLGAVDAQYADFALWEQTHFTDAAPLLERQLEYWKERLQGIDGPLQLPVDRQISDDRAHAGGREVFSCPADTIDGLKRLARESNATLFMALLAVFNIVLMRYSGQDDILVGLPTTNRTQSSLNGIVGVFINTIILRTDLSGDPTFRTVLARVRDVAMGAQANQEVPFQRVVQSLGLKGDGARSLARVLFDFQKKVDLFVETPGFTVRGAEVTNGMAKFDLVLAMEDSGDEIKGILDYDAEKYEAATAQQIARHFNTLMRSVAAAPDSPITLLPMLGDDELALVEASGLDTSDRQSVSACVATERFAQEAPQALALSDGVTQFTFGELSALATQVANFLSRRNVGRRQTVALFMPPGPALVAAQFGIMKAGAAFVPIDPTWPADRVAFLIRDSRAALTIVGDDQVNDIQASGETIRLSQVLNEAPKADSLSAPSTTEPDDPAYVIYTSGSTGQPKGVALSRSNLANLAVWHQRAFGVSPNDRASQMASVSFDASVWEIWANISAGASIHFPPRGLIADAARTRDWLVQRDITISFAPTLLAEELIELDWPASTKLRWLLTGGDRLRKHPKRDLAFRLVNNYGPTEATVVTTSGLVESAAQGGAPSIGRPIDNVWLRIVDRNLQPVPPGVWGELIVGGRAVGLGYWGSAESAAGGFATLPDGRRVYRTGDLCRIRRDGEIEFLGRADRQVQVHGCRVELSEIERTLLELPDIREAAVVPRESPDGRVSLAAYLVPAGGAAPKPEALRTYLAAKLPSYMLPSSFATIGQLPRTTSGKTDWKRLAEDAGAGGSRAAFCKPRTVTESRLVELWQQILRLSAVGVQDDFFQIGGDSLSATRLALRVRELFDIDLPLSRMVARPTIEALASFLDDAQQRTEKLPDEIVPLRSGRGMQPPLFLAPPASGSPACYAVWASAFEGDRAVYGLLSPGFSGGKVAASIPDQARAYLTAIYAVQSSGPYHIAGWSLGAPLAFEIACQLREAGKQVAYLGLVDGALPENGKLPGNISLLRGLWWAVTYPFSERMPLNYATVRQLANFLGIALPPSLLNVRQRGWRASAQFLGELVAGAGRSLRVFLANVRGLRSYQPRYFDGAVTLFRTQPPADVSEDALLNSMAKWCARVDMRDAPGTHMTLILDPQQATQFAPMFESTLEPKLKLVVVD
ncbi:MAG: amino acid adenylation domain-containing protein [Xanthobacteraceae bacterium]